MWHWWGLLNQIVQTVLYMMWPLSPCSHIERRAADCRLTCIYWACLPGLVCWIVGGDCNDHNDCETQRVGCGLSLGGAYCSLWWCMLYERHMVWKPLLGGIACFKHKLRDNFETNTILYIPVDRTAQGNSWRIQSSIRSLLGDYCRLVCF